MPQFHIPQAAVPWLTGILSVSAGLSQVVPSYTILGKVLQLLLAFGPALAAMSPGFNNSNQ